MTAFSHLSPEQRLNSTAMTPKQYGMIGAETAKLGWTWAEVALFAHLQVGYPYYEIGREASMSLTKKEAWEICNYLSATQPSQLIANFKELKAKHPDRVTEWQQYWAGREEEQDIRRSQPVHRDCPKCHQHYHQVDANFCMVDGTKLRELGVCTECGERLVRPTAKFCIECGAPQTQASTNAQKVHERTDPGPKDAADVIPFPSSTSAGPIGQLANTDDPFADAPEEMDGPF